MRIPTSDGAGQRGSRRRGRGRANPGSDRDTAGLDADRTAASRDTGSRDTGGRRAVGSNGPGSSGFGPPRAGTRTTSAQHGAGPASSGTAGRGGESAGSSVFAPGYDGSWTGGDPAPARTGTRGSSSWYGSSGGGAVGKGPVRGYPPAPGQPPPMYPPGQFAAWNAGQDSRSRPRSQPDPQDGSQPNRGASAEPGYSELAVSDPAADVTSTQTWRAVADGRSTGTWTAPARPGGQPSSPRSASGRHGVPPGAARPDTASPDTASLDLSGPRKVVTAPGRLEPATGAAQPAIEGRDRSGRSGAHSGPQAAVRTERGPQAEPRPPRGKSPASGKRPSSRKRPASVKLALSVAILLVLTAAATLAYVVLHRAVPPKPAPATAASRQPKVTASPSQGASLGPYGHIASRQSDPQLLTIAQLFPASFKIGGQAVTLEASAISRHCGAAVTGSNLQSAVSSAHCDQAVRATYLARAQGLMGTVGVLNLSTAAKAANAAKAADASDYITQLKGKRGPTRRIGNGTGIEEALAKGHYLILIWAEFSSLNTPKRAAQRHEVVTFMTDMLQNTANVSLATRMLTGSP